MAVEDNMEHLIVQKVLEQLAKEGLLKNTPPESSNPEVLEKSFQPSVITGDYIEFPAGGEYVELLPVDEVLIKEPVKRETVEMLKSQTPARIGVGRAGTRYRTATLLRFLADHSQAQDAVFVDVSDRFIENMGLVQVQTQVSSREEHLTRPDLGSRLSQAAKDKLLSSCRKNVQVQIVVADGLSSKAVESNVPELLPALLQGLKGEGITNIGTTCFVKYGRVRVEDEIGMLLNAEVVVELIGERPGLVTANSLSAYIIYNPTGQTVEADRTVVSNIHQEGTPPVEAGAFLATLIKDILEAKASGIKLTKAWKEGVAGGRPERGSID